VGLQRLENKVLSWGIIGKSAPILAEITIRKSQVLKPDNVYYFRIDQPLFSTARKRLIEHFTRVETFGSPNVHWVRVIVDPSDPQVFTFKPEIVRKNLVKHGAQ